MVQREPGLGARHLDEWLMQLTIVGCGTAAPDGERVCSGYFLESGGVRLLLDCGPGVVHNMARLGMDWSRLTHLVLTHFHNDHIGDVPMLFFAFKYGLRPERRAPLVVIGPRGTRRLFDRLAEGLGEHLKETDFEVRFEELQHGESHALSDTLRLSAARAQHTPEALCYRVETAAGSLGFSGDTGPSDEVARHLQGAHTVICECAIPDAEAMPFHLTPTQVAEMARSMLPHRLVITHVYPQLDRHAVPAMLRDAGWDGEVIVAHDGMRLEIPS
jgi:ribonuclease BN (tRNA processing enzyme)